MTTEPSDDVKRLGIAVAMMLKAFTADGIFGFEWDAFKALSNSEDMDIHIGTLHMPGPVTGNDTKVIVVWVGEKHTEDIETWAQGVDIHNLVEVMPIASPDASIN